jgi:hypothetical protein
MGGVAGRSVDGRPNPGRPWVGSASQHRGSTVLPSSFSFFLFFLFSFFFRMDVGLMLQDVEFFFFAFFFPLAEVSACEWWAKNLPFLPHPNERYSQ